MPDRITDTIAEALEPYLFNEDQGYVSPTVRRQWSYSVTDIVLAALRANNIEPIQLPEPDSDRRWDLAVDRVTATSDEVVMQCKGLVTIYDSPKMARERAAALLAAAAAAEEGK